MTYANINGYKYGRARLAYLKKHKPLLHVELLTQGKLWAHLLEAQQTATERMERLTKQMAAAQGLTEELKARDQMEWLGRMNNVRASAEEFVYREVICG